MSAQPALRHNLEQYKKQAKDLRKAHQSADPEAVALVCQHLPRLNQDDAAERISLQEAQYVVARKHKFKDWNWLHAVCALDFELLTRLKDRELQVLLREADQKDLVIALKTSSEAVQERIFANMSLRVRDWLREEMEFLGPLSTSESETMQQLILLQAAELALQGELNWPDGDPIKTRPATERAAAAPEQHSQLAALAARPIEDMTLDEIAKLWAGFTELARRYGILYLDGFDASPMVRESLVLLVDGTEPALIADALLTRAEHALLASRETRGKMVIEALMSLHSGDNPGLVHYKLHTIFADYQTPTAGRPERRTIEEIALRLELRLQQRYFNMDYGEIAALFTDMSYLARQNGLAALRPYSEKIDYPMLRLGIELIDSDTPADQIVEALEAQLGSDLQKTRFQYRACIAGALSVQKGDNPRETVRTVGEAASWEWKQIMGFAEANDSAQAD